MKVCIKCEIEKELSEFEDQIVKMVIEMIVKNVEKSL